MYSLGSIMFLRSTCLQWVLLNIFCQLWPSLISNRHKPCKWPYKWHSSEVYFQMVHWFQRKKCLQHVPYGGHLEFLINITNINFVDEQTKHIPAKCTFKWFTGLREKKKKVTAFISEFSWISDLYKTRDLCNYCENKPFSTIDHKITYTKSCNNGNLGFLINTKTKMSI